MPRSVGRLFLLGCLALLMGQTARGADAAAEKQPARQGPAPRVDRHGDPLPPVAVARLGTIRWRHILRDWSGFGLPNVSPDGKYVVSAGDVGLRLWDATTGKRLDWFAVDVPGFKAALLTPDGKSLLTAVQKEDRDNSDFWRVRWTIDHREVGTGKLQRRIEIVASRENHEFPQFSRDGRFFIGSERENKIVLWDTTTGRKYAQIAKQPSYWNPFAISPDNKMLAVAAHDTHLYLYELPSGRQVHKLPPAGELSFSVHYAPAFAPDGKTLLTSGPKSLFVWDVTTGKLRHEVKDCRGPVAFTADGKLLACGDSDGIVLFEAATLRKVRRFDPPSSSPLALAFSPDGKRLLSGQDYSTAVWDVQTGKQINVVDGHEVPVVSLAFSPDGKSLASGADGDERALVWDVATGRLRHQLGGHFFSATSFAFSADGRILATGDGFSRDQTGSNEASVRLWDLDRGRLTRQFVAHLTSVHSLAFAPDGKTLATAGYDDRARVWESATGKRLLQVRNPVRSLAAASLSPDGKALLISGSGGEVGLWRADTGQKLHDLGTSEGGQRRVRFAKFLRDGRTVISKEEGDRESPPVFRFWDARTGKLRRTLKAPPSPYDERAQALSPDGTLFAAGVNGDYYHPVFLLWDVEAERPLVSLSGHFGDISALVFSPDGRTLATGSRDTTILLWDVAQARLEALWNELAENDQAMRKMASDPDRMVPFLTERLAKAAATEARVHKLIADLDSPRFKVREKASEALAKLGPEAEAGLRQALEGQLSTEARRRVRTILDGFGKLSQGSPQDPQRLRLAVKILEALDSKEARQVLRERAGGDPGLLVTRLAREAVERMGKKERPR
jgi:WD40 repeat protein